MLPQWGVLGTKLGTLDGMDIGSSNVTYLGLLDGSTDGNTDENFDSLLICA